VIFSGRLCDTRANSVQRGVEFSDCVNASLTGDWQRRLNRELEEFTKTISECSVQFSAEATDNSEGHYRDTCSYFSAVDMGRKAT
jgi:hypothetical protein